MPLETTSLFEKQFNEAIIDTISNLERDLVNYINHRLFFNFPDVQSSHQYEPIRKWLDVTFGLYGGQYPDDVYNLLTSEHENIMRDAFLNVTQQESLSIDYWVDKVTGYWENVKQYKNYPEKTSRQRLAGSENVTNLGDICDYVSQILDDNFSGRRLPKQIHNELNDELEERAYIADQYVYSEEDFDMLKRSSDRFIPSRSLVKHLLERRLNPKKRLLKWLEIKPNTNRCISFFRHDVDRGILLKAHADEATIIDTLKDLDADEIDLKHVALFFHIIVNRFGVDHVCKLLGELSEEEQTYLLTEFGVIQSARFMLCEYCVEFNLHQVLDCMIKFSNSLSTTIEEKGLLSMP